MLAQHGYGVLWFDFRGHGRSQASKVTFGLHEVQDTKAAVDFLLDQHEVNPEQIGVLGISMGGAIAILAAAQNPNISAVAIEGVFAELRDEVGIGIELKTPLPARPFDSILFFCWLNGAQTCS